MTPEFVDTNVLIYAYDPSAGERHARALELVGELGRERRGALSVQVLQEFFVTVTLKLTATVTAEEALTSLAVLSRWQAHAPLPQDVLVAARLADEHQLSFWDAMIVRSAQSLGCSKLWTEDLNHGQRIGGVQIVNPFA
jgi:predicted nucleic acid-binding protein